MTAVQTVEEKAAPSWLLCGGCRKMLCGKRFTQAGRVPAGRAQRGLTTG